jgi:glycosyltransferase involved in cell wall biosynthesis
MTTVQTGLARASLDLEHWAPLESLRERRSRDLKRLQRVHRLASPIVLYAGPYDAAGGLDLAIEAALDVRERKPDIRLVAIPLGAIDRRYLDRCERRALALGHHGVIEWSVPTDDLPLWFALADVVCAPYREAAASGVELFAAAAGRPLVATDVAPFAGFLDDETGILMANPLDPAHLVAAIEALISDSEEARRPGAAARLKMEKGLPTAAAASPV